MSARHGLALRGDESGEARGVDGELGDRLVRVGRAALSFVVRLCHVRGEDEDLVLVRDHPRRRFRGASREASDGHDGAGGDGVEIEAFAKVGGGAETAVLDPRAGFDSREPLLHAN